MRWTNTGSNTPPNGGGGGGWRQFAYDDFGQMVYRAQGAFIPNGGSWKREVDLKWDSQRRLREARDRSAGNRQLQSATYTADGERITKSDPITGAQINSYGLHDTNRNTIYTPGVGFRAAGTDRFHHADRLGSTRALTDGAGRVDTVKSKARYSAFGEAEIQGPDGDHPTEHQFAGAWGYEREPSATGLGLDYLYQRYYDPAIGRFISADPIGLAGGLNLYGYCAGDPVNAVDPSGEDWLDYAAGWGEQTGQVLAGYGDLLNPLNKVTGTIEIVRYTVANGPVATAQAMAKGMVASYTDWWSTSDSRRFGRSFGTVLLTAAPPALYTRGLLKSGVRLRDVPAIAVKDSVQMWRSRPRRVLLRMLTQKEYDAWRENGNLPCPEAPGKSTLNMFGYESLQTMKQYAANPNTPQKYLYLAEIRTIIPVRALRPDAQMQKANTMNYPVRGLTRPGTRVRYDQLH